MLILKAILFTGSEHTRHSVSTYDNFRDRVGIVAARKFCIQSQGDLNRCEAFATAQDSFDVVGKSFHGQEAIMEIRRGL